MESVHTKFKVDVMVKKVFGIDRAMRRGSGRSLRHVVDSFYWMNLSLRNWVVWSSTFFMNLSRKLFLFEEERVGQPNSSRMSLIVSRSSNTSVSDTPFSGKVGSAGWVKFSVLWKFSQDATCFIVDVVVCRLPANCHH
jgi:hypothetical protein